MKRPTQQITLDVHLCPSTPYRAPPLDPQSVGINSCGKQYSLDPSQQCNNICPWPTPVHPWRWCRKSAWWNKMPDLHDLPVNHMHTQNSSSIENITPNGMIADRFKSIECTTAQGEVTVEICPNLLRDILNVWYCTHTSGDRQEHVPFNICRDLSECNKCTTVDTHTHIGQVQTYCMRQMTHTVHDSQDEWCVSICISALQVDVGDGHLHAKVLDVISLQLQQSSAVLPLLGIEQFLYVWRTTKKNSVDCDDTAFAKVICTSTIPPARELPWKQNYNASFECPMWLL